MIVTRQINLFGAVIEAPNALRIEGLVSAIPVAKKPVRIFFMKGKHANEHLSFWCQGYRPYGANPEYLDDRKYRGDSQTCDGCFKIIDGVPFEAPFHCRRECHGSKHFIDADQDQRDRLTTRLSLRREK